MSFGRTFSSSIPYNYWAELKLSVAKRKTLLKGKYLLFKQISINGTTLFPLLSLKNIKENNYVIETFIVEDNISLLGALEEEKIIDIKLIPPKVKVLQKS